jgi:regulator of protease activity HflC (stomatin/prohibitin superfamily)
MPECSRQPPRCHAAERPTTITENPYFAVPEFFVAVTLLITLVNAVQILREYERAVVFTLGRFARVRGPGLVLLIPFIQEMVRADLHIQVIEIPSQDVISRDNVSMKVDAEVEFQASQTRVKAARILGSIPAAMQLRYLQTLIEIGGEQNSTIVFPISGEVIRPFMDILERTDKAGAAPNGALRPPVAEARTLSQSLF